MALRTTTGAGTQTTTGTPQAVGSSSGTNSSNAANGSEVQPGTATDLLNSNSGITLSGTPLTVVNLNSAATTSSTQSTVEVTQNDQQINPVGIGFAVLLFVVAIVFFWLTSRSAKNTT